MLAAMFLFQKGTPFLYQGQEIGMLNWRPANPEMYEDVQTRWQYANTNQKKSPEERLQRLWRSSRDSARTPVQWSAEPNAGFTTGEPWFYINPNYKQINVSQQEADPDSILNFYRKAIHLRKSLPAVRHGTYTEHFKNDSSLYIYAREGVTQRLLVVCSFADRPVGLKIPKGFDLSKAKLILQNYDKPELHLLMPYETRVYLWNKV